MGCCHYYQFTAAGDDLFTVDVSRIRFGPGALRELGSEVRQSGIQPAAVFTDSDVVQVERFADALDTFYHTPCLIQNLAEYGSFSRRVTRMLGQFVLTVSRSLSMLRLPIGLLPSLPRSGIWRAHDF